MQIANGTKATLLYLGTIFSMSYIRGNFMFLSVLHIQMLNMWRHSKEKWTEFHFFLHFVIVNVPRFDTEYSVMVTYDQIL